MIEWYRDSPKLLREKILTFSGSSSIISTIKEIPLKAELILIFFVKILKLKGHPFFKTSFTYGPSNSIVAFE